MTGSGGIGSYLQALLPFFLKDFECLLIGTEKQLSKFNESPALKKLFCDIKPFSIKDSFLFPRNFLKTINTYDLYYSPYCNIPSGIRIPVVSTIHDVVFLDIPELAGSIGTFVRKIFYKRAVFKSKCIFTVSDFSKQRIESHLKPAKTPVIVTYNALPPWFSIPENKVEKENYILFVGNIKKHKGLHTLLDAYKKIHEINSTLKLMIVGNSENFRTNDQDITLKFNELKDSVSFTGFISDAELKNIYCKAKLLIQPSLYEGFGMPPLEALSLGTNVILSDIPVFKEIYKDLPVNFFKTEDSSDLADKVINCLDLPEPEIINNPYSFERTYNIICESINHFNKG